MLSWQNLEEKLNTTLTLSSRVVLLYDTLLVSFHTFPLVILNLKKKKVSIHFHCSWILYEKPDFHGRSIALEEGGIELTNVWAETEVETEPHNSPPMLIGSIRLAVWVSALVKYFHLIWPLISTSSHFTWPSKM